MTIRIRTRRAFTVLILSVGLPYAAHAVNLLKPETPVPAVAVAGAAVHQPAVVPVVPEPSVWGLMVVGAVMTLGSMHRRHYFGS